MAENRGDRGPSRRTVPSKLWTRWAFCRGKGGVPVRCEKKSPQGGERKGDRGLPVELRRERCLEIVLKTKAIRNAVEVSRGNWFANSPAGRTSRLPSKRGLAVNSANKHVEG